MARREFPPRCVKHKRTTQRGGDSLLAPVKPRNQTKRGNTLLAMLRMKKKDGKGGIPSSPC